MGHLHFDNWGPRMNDELTEAFIGSTRWPIGTGALAALVDLGMSDGAIAEYFDVERAAVTELRADYGL